jgi:hypothetical protein
MATLQEILSPSVVTGVISRIRTPQSRLQNFFGMQLGGANNNPIGRRYFSWDIFDKTRQVAQMRAPGTGPSRVQKQSIMSIPLLIWTARLLFQSSFVKKSS